MKKTVIFSVFGQIEGIVADAAVAEGWANRIEPYDIPESVRYNDKGEIAHCALVMDRKMEAVYDKRVKSLRT